MQVFPWHYMPNVSWLTTLTVLPINSWNTCTYFVYFKSKKELNYDRFVDLNILGAARLVHSDLRIYWISFFLLDVNEMKLNESGFRPPLCTYRLNWARRTSWGWWDDWDDTVLQTQDSKLEPYSSTLPLGHGGSPQYWLSHVDGEETFLFLLNRRLREPNPELCLLDVKRM